MELAWDMLEVAKAIYTENDVPAAAAAAAGGLAAAGRGPADAAGGGGPAEQQRQQQLRSRVDELLDTLMLLGDISTENECFDAAMADYDRCAALQVCVCMC